MNSTFVEELKKYKIKMEKKLISGNLWVVFLFAFLFYFLFVFVFSDFIYMMTDNDR